MSVSLLNTRPDPMGTELQRLCSQHGIDSLHRPMISTQPLPFQVGESLVSDLARADIAWIFISRTAVNRFAECTLQAKRTFAPTGRVIAVGPGSRSQLEQHFPALRGRILCPAQANSESLVTMTELQPSEVSKAWLIKGDGGRTLMAEHFKANNIELEPANLYRRCPVQYERVDVRQWQDYTHFLATSVDIAMALFDNIHTGMTEDEQSTLLGKVKWLVLSERIKAFLLTLSVPASQIFICEQSDNSSIINNINI